jgi:putative cardiolipin synthase
MREKLNVGIAGPRKGFAPLALTLLLGSLGCRALQPVDLPKETAVAPVTNRLWSAVEQQRAGNWFHLLNEGESALEWRWRAVESATRSVDLQTFLWKEDRVGRLLFRQVLEAADRGVKVRLLLDDTFTIGENDLLHGLDQHPNIAIRIYNPFQRRSDSVVLRQLLNLGEFSRLDHRMHNKVLVVDNRAAIVGGRNLADEYFGRHDADNFRDMEVLCAGPLTPEISQCFDDYWNSPWSFPVARILTPPPQVRDLAHLRFRWSEGAETRPQENADTRLARWLHVVDMAVGGAGALLFDQVARTDPAHREERPDQLAKALLEWIDRAEQEIVLVSAYLIPTPELEAAVERAEKRGVKVRILTNSLQSNNHTSAHSAYRHHMHRLVDHGADVHEVRARAKDRARYMQMPVDAKTLGLHAKLLLIDQQYTFIGSANLDPRSLRLNTEIGLMITSPELNRQMRELLGIDFHSRNAWHLKRSGSGEIVWEADDMTLTTQPADSTFQRLEDWFLGILPFESEL